MLGIAQKVGFHGRYRDVYVSLATIGSSHGGNVSRIYRGSKERRGSCYFHAQSPRLACEIESIRRIISQPINDPSYVTASTVKEGTEKLLGMLEGNENHILAKELASIGRTYEATVLKVIENRALYNEAMQTKVTNDANIKYGVLGVSLVCVFGSLGVSLHPVFLLGSAIGAYIYRPVFRQSQLREEVSKKMDHYMEVNTEHRKQLAALRAQMISTLEQLEMSVSGHSQEKAP